MPRHVKGTFSREQTSGRLDMYFSRERDSAVLRQRKHIFFMAASVIPLLGLLLSGCGFQTGTGSSVASTPQADRVALQMCQNSQVSTTLTQAAPVEAQQLLYVAASDHLYAVNASNGAVRWCQQ